MAPAPRIVQLRIHGIGGSSRSELLGEGDAERLTADATEHSGFWESSNPLPDGTTVQGYLWGRHRPVDLGLWFALLAFTLVNVAGWTVASGAPTSANRFDAQRRAIGARLARWLVAALGLSLTAAWTLWMLAIVGQDLAYKPGLPGWVSGVIGLATVGVLIFVVWPGRDARRGPWIALLATLALVVVAQRVDRNATLALAAAAAATGLPFALAGSNGKQFEQYRARLGGSGTARERRRLADEETLASPCFYDHPTETTGLLILHGIVAASILGIVWARALTIDRPPITEAALHPLLDAGDAGTPFIGHALLIVGLAQAALVAALIIAGLLGSSCARAGGADVDWRSTRGALRIAINALRPASIAGIGVFLFTAPVGSLNVVTARLHDEHIQLKEFPHLDLYPAFLLAASVSGLGVLGWYGLRSVFPDALDQRPTGLRRAWAWVRARRTLIANTDVLLVVVGVLLGAALVLAALVHRDWSWQLVPQDTVRFRGPELWPLRAAGWIAGLVLMVPVLVMVLALASNDARRGVSALWDLLTFWPRRFSPLGAPPETERAVPEVQAHLLRLLDDSLDDNDSRVQIRAHSQGGTIAFAALVGLRDRGKLERVGLVTLGSSLFALYPRLFPAQVSPELTAELAGALGPRWVNPWRPSDPFTAEPAPQLPELGAISPMVAFVGTKANGEQTLLGHIGYDTAPDVERLLKRQRQVLRRPSAPTVEPIDSFAPRRTMVSWLDPRLLALTAYEAGVSTVFGKWADARRVSALDTGADHLAISAADGRAGAVLWVDYVADPGDAFAPTFAVALQLAQRNLRVEEGDPAVEKLLPRGDVLIMGGDEVYPTASQARYRNQLIGPYALASRCVVRTDHHHPSMLAIPGNHDWYDGLRSFDELIQPGTEIGNWTCRQSRSYWAARLEANGAPTKWWLWGVDLQLDNVFDRHQRKYFKTVACQLQPGDKVILCSPIPVWAHARDEPTSFDELGNFVEDVIATKQAEVVMHLSGDSHHYAHYVRDNVPETSGEPVHYVTAGGGGAFTHPTHHLHETIELPTAYDDDRRPTLQLRHHPHPSARQSGWSLIGRNLGPRFYLQNKSFGLLLGTTAAIASYMASFGGTPLDVGAGELERGLGDTAGLFARNTMSVGLALVALAGWVAFGKKRAGGSAAVAKLAGLVHGAVQVAAMIVTAWVSLAVARRVHRSAADTVHDVLATREVRASVAGVADRLCTLGLAMVIGALLGMFVLSVYFVLTNWLLGMHDNEAASAVASTKYKHFLRIRIDTAADTADVWALHVPDPERLAEPFRMHDARPRVLTADRPDVKLWEHFVIGGDT